MENTQKAIDKKLSIREKLGIYVLLIILKIIGPWEYSHQFESMIKELKDIIQNKVTE